MISDVLETDPISFMVLFSFSLSGEKYRSLEKAGTNLLQVKLFAFGNQMNGLRQDHVLINSYGSEEMPPVRHVSMRPANISLARDSPSMQFQDKSQRHTNLPSHGSQLLTAINVHQPKRTS